MPMGWATSISAAAEHWLLDVWTLLCDKFLQPQGAEPIFSTLVFMKAFISFVEQGWFSGASFPKPVEAMDACACLGLALESQIWKWQWHFFIWLQSNLKTLLTAGLQLRFVSYFKAPYWFCIFAVINNLIPTSLGNQLIHLHFYEQFNYVTYFITVIQNVPWVDLDIEMDEEVFWQHFFLRKILHINGILQNYTSLDEPSFRRNQRTGA